LANAASLSDANGAARSNYFRIQLAFFLRDFGVHLVANDRVFHFHEDRPGAIGAAWLDDGEAGRVLRHLRSLSLDEGAPAPLGRQGGTQWRSARLGGGPSPQEKKRATGTRAKVNEAIVALREADRSFLAICEEQERLLANHRALTSELWDRPDRRPSWQKLVKSEE
jgi:hypothetical protein